MFTIYSNFNYLLNSKCLPWEDEEKINLVKITTRKKYSISYSWRDMS